MKILNIDNSGVFDITTRLKYTDGILPAALVPVPENKIIIFPNERLGESIPLNERKTLGFGVEIGPDAKKGTYIVEFTVDRIPDLVSPANPYDSVQQLYLNVK